MADDEVPLVIGVDQQGHRAVLTLNGELELISAPQLADCLDQVIHHGCTEIVLDVSGLLFCDSSGLRTFVITAKRCALARGWLRLAGPRPHLVRVLTVTGLLTAIPTYANLNAAIDGHASDRIDD
jgi:anti-anti-sigma factor